MGKTNRFMENISIKELQYQSNIEEKNKIIKEMNKKLEEFSSMRFDSNNAPSKSDYSN